LELADSPNRFLSTVQIGISLIGVLSGAVGGAALSDPLARVLFEIVPGLAPYAGAITFGVVVGTITYLTLILGELVPKRLALNGAETVASRVAGPMRLLSTLASPAVWFLGVSTDAVLRLLRVRSSDDPPVSEREVEILLEEGARAGVFEEEERDLARRALRLDDRPVRALMTPRPAIEWLDADAPPEEHRRSVAESRHSYYPVARGDLDELLWAYPRSRTPWRTRSARESPPTWWAPCEIRRCSRRAFPPRRRWRRSSGPAYPWRLWSTSAATSKDSSRRPTSSRPSWAISKGPSRRR
jgi:putative hemolysin